MENIIAVTALGPVWKQATVRQTVQQKSTNHSQYTLKEMSDVIHHH